MITLDSGITLGITVKGLICKFDGMDPVGAMLTGSVLFFCLVRTIYIFYYGGE